MCVFKGQITGVPMRPTLCTSADDLLRDSATVRNLGEGDSHPYFFA